MIVALESVALSKALYASFSRQQTRSRKAMLRPHGIKYCYVPCGIVYAVREFRAGRCVCVKSLGRGQGIRGLKLTNCINYFWKKTNIQYKSILRPQYLKKQRSDQVFQITLVGQIFCGLLILDDASWFNVTITLFLARFVCVLTSLLNQLIH